MNLDYSIQDLEKISQPDSTSQRHPGQHVQGGNQITKATSQQKELVYSSKYTAKELLSCMANTTCSSKNESK